MKNILVAIDFLPISQRLVEHAANWAEKFGAKIWLVHVAAPDPEFVGYDVGPQYIRDSRADVLRQEHQDLQAYAKRLEDKGLNAEALLIQGPTVETLVKEAGKLHADLIVLGAEPHGKVFDALFGSIWADVVKKVKTPVMLISG
ncbi:MAG: universal stress protein [Bacteroidetes bacterium]|nr:universal stress protein [Bacteroidota bacterium]